MERPIQITLDNGRIILYNADSRFISLPPADLIIADPPYYNVIKDRWDNEWDTLDDHLHWSEQWLSNIRLKDTGSLYVFGSIGERSDTIIHIKLLIDKIGLHFKDWITWKKDRGMGNRRGWVYAREEILWYVKDNKQFIWNTAYQYGDERRKRDKGLPLGQIRVSQNGHYAKSEFKRLTSVITDISEQAINKKKHYTPKPYKLIQRLIDLHTTDLEQLVIDPFLGSGTTGEVCARKGQRFIGIEKDTDNFNEAVSYIKQALQERNENNFS